MIYLVDTNIISELARPQPDSGAEEWADGIAQVSVSVVTLEELQFGLSWRPNPRIQAWLDEFLEHYCDVVPVSIEVARLAGEWRGRFQANGLARTQADMLIAATAAVNGLTLVTRNVKDFDGCGITILNPFS